MNDQRYRRVEKEIYTNVRHNETRPDNTLGLYHPDMGHFGASPTANNRGDAPLALLQMCWKNINYLSSAQETSIHTYNLQ